ncbi:hypothetical protein QBC38DRAFT_468962 [Podospora fimiseda]|uniref:BZIP domain-containing protein n=1 Tax=Podospora fimiseda TaxID=252190 RepID=A0AAN7H480_9PEZI|nr:hypothetical protein QBC38DRAFT_468962 [Podospora fimiseda]
MKTNMMDWVGPLTEETPGEPSLTKSQQRRAQVRRAQIQHRQRKAHYVKKLETDTERYREMIANIRREASEIHAENEVIRAQLLEHSSKLPLDQSLAFLDKIPAPLTHTVPENSNSNDNVTMMLGYDDIMKTPCFSISSEAGETVIDERIFSDSPLNPQLPDMTPHQIQQAINFILALEHICRDHSHPSHFPSSSSFPSSENHSNGLTGRASGHTLMATSLALRTAPPTVFSAAKKTRLFPGSSISFRPPSPDSPDAVSWKTSGLTLQNLYGLACSLHGKDDEEITPVQVWFELVRRYGVETVLSGIDEMKREFVGVVKCPAHFGAVLERGAFESVVGRVLGCAAA